MTRMGLTYSRRVTAQCLELIKEFEGLHDGNRATPNILEPMADPVGIYTVGWGYALFENGRPVRVREHAYRIWRQRWPHGFGLKDADSLLESVAQEVWDKVIALLPGRVPRDHELAAMTSLAYNIGVGEVGGRADFADSTVRRRFLQGDIQGAADAFLMWRYAGGRELPGLVRRRERERAIFLRGW